MPSGALASARWKTWSPTSPPYRGWLPRSSRCARCRRRATTMRLVVHRRAVGDPAALRGAIAPGIRAAWNHRFRRSDAGCFGRACERRRPSDLLLAVDMRIEHLLVDEFQDTSLAQYELIERLTAGWDAGDGRTLFVVGDPDAVDLPLPRSRRAAVPRCAARTRRIGGVALEPLTLSRELPLAARARRVGQRRVSAGARRRATSRCAAPWRSSPRTAARASRPNAASRSISRATPQAKPCRSWLGSQARTARRMRRHRGAGAHAFRPGAAPARAARRAASRSRRSSSIGSRRAPGDPRSHVAHARADATRRPSGVARGAARALVRLDAARPVRLIADCGETPLVDAVAGVLAGPVRSRLSADGRSRLERFVAAVAPALRGSRPRAAGDDGARRVACARRTGVRRRGDRSRRRRARASRCSPSMRRRRLPDWPAFCDGARRRCTPTPEIDAATRVQVMTLHRAKGLEFDVVIMPGLARRPRHSEPQLLRWRERPAGLLLAPMRARGAAERRRSGLRVPADAWRGRRRRRARAGCSTSAARARGASASHRDRGSSTATGWQVRTWKRPPRRTRRSRRCGRR